MNFTVFKAAIAKQFDVMQAHPMFRTDVDKDALWQTYLKSFPKGSNPKFRERTEHDCNCCKQFIRAVGDAVAVIDGKIISIWDARIGDDNYQAVADAMATLVKSQPIANVFMHREKTAGTDKNLQQLLDGVQTWTHFFVNIKPEVVVRGEMIGGALGEHRSTHDVFLRSMNEITTDAIDTVLDLIAQNSLYRGEEHRFAVSEFARIKKEIDTKYTADFDRHALIWLASVKAPQSVSRIRNTAIGTLLVDLSEGKDVEDAVKSFEDKVAPTNYKRPTALVTKAMVEKAQQKIAELGLASAMGRRYATTRDVTVNNILFANRRAKRAMAGDVFDDIAAAVPDSAKRYGKVEEITIDKFVADILPRADSVEVMFENRHTGNLVSLIAPVDATAGSLFKWDNNFSWSYNGDVADSIKERVKKAGGNVSGDLCCRLAWFNYDDLDLHMHEPGGEHIFFGNKRPHGTTGQLDVDMNAGGRHTRDAVENIFYPQRAKLKEGLYRLEVNNYNRREADNVGFEVEIDFMGAIMHFAHAKPLRNGETVAVASFKYTHRSGLELVDSLPHSTTSKEVWGLKTLVFHPLSMLMMSPNHWDGAGVGNRHFFFMIDGCRNPDGARGFYNEFLRNDLDVHRKVFEIAGSKVKTEAGGEQLSGLGFSSTQKNSVLCRIKGSLSRVVKITF